MKEKILKILILVPAETSKMDDLNHELYNRQHL